MAPQEKKLKTDMMSLAKRVSALEAALAQSIQTIQSVHTAQSPPAPDISGSADRDGSDEFWALNELHARRSDQPTTRGGAVMIVGSLNLPDGSPIRWQQGLPTEGMLETDWSDAATALGALGHPVRVELLRHLLSGVRATAELAELGSLGTTGQLHHHLRQLVAAGWVRQSGHGRYEVPVARVVPLLACVMGAER